ncbi:hypothetical protein ILYODFUR_026847, partial [Ilyodon furcidens]
ETPTSSQSPCNSTLAPPFHLSGKSKPFSTHIPPPHFHVWHSPLMNLMLLRRACLSSQYSCAYRALWLNSKSAGGSAGFSGCFDTDDSGLWFICGGVRDVHQTGEFRMARKPA